MTRRSGRKIDSELRRMAAAMERVAASPPWEVGKQFPHFGDAMTRGVIAAVYYLAMIEMTEDEDDYFSQWPDLIAILREDIDESLGRELSPLASIARLTQALSDLFLLISQEAMETLSYHDTADSDKA